MSRRLDCIPEGQPIDESGWHERAIGKGLTVKQTPVSMAQ